MKQEAIDKALKIDGLMQPEELAIIYDLVDKYVSQGGKVFETGTFKGRTSMLIAEALKEKNGSLTTIDCYGVGGEYRGEYEGYSLEMTTENLKEYPITIINGRFIDVLDKIEDCDLAFLDGDHTLIGIRLELSYFSLFAKTIAGHDYGMVESELKRFVDKHPEYKLEQFNTIYGLWCLTNEKNSSQETN